MQMAGEPPLDPVPAEGIIAAVDDEDIVDLIFADIGRDVRAGALDVIERIAQIGAEDDIVADCRRSGVGRGNIAAAFELELIRAAAEGEALQRGAV